MPSNSSPPLWQQILEDLLLRIAAGEFSERFATDAELVAHYRVSRHTVREALRRLQADGLVVRQRGRGSHLSGGEVDFEQPAGALYSLFRAVEAQGREQTSVVRKLTILTDAPAAVRLGLAPDSLLIYLERLRLADGTPLALDRVWLPGRLAHPLLDVDFTHTALYLELEKCCGLRPAGGRERIQPVVPGRGDARLLGLRPGAAAFAIERSTWVEAGQPLEWRHSLVRGDRYAFSSEWAGSSGDLKMSFRSN